MIDRYITKTEARTRHRSGVLGPHVDRFAGWMAEAGYSRKQKLLQLHRFNLWLTKEGASIQELDEALVTRFLEQVPRSQRSGTPRTLEQFLGMLRSEGVLPPAVPTHDSPLDLELGRFAAYLRGLGRNAVTIRQHVWIIHRLLSEVFGRTPPQPAKLSFRDLTEFVVRFANVWPGSHPRPKAALRVYFRYLCQRGVVEENLAEAIPPVRRWRLAGIPDRLTAGEVERLLQVHREPESKVEIRNLAILLLLVRLGLRSGEILVLTLDDIDWRSGILNVTDKYGVRHQMPIPSDAGEALARYLREARPASSHREVFLRSRAPFCPLTYTAVGHVAGRAIVRAGLRDRGNARLLRHSFASALVNNGASLAEVSQVLRHNKPSSTQVYAKVNLVSLRELAQPWPEELS